MKKNLHNRITTSIILIAFLIITFFSKIFLVSTLLIFSILSIIEFFNISKKIFKENHIGIIINVLFIFYVFTFSIFFFTLSNFDYLKIVLFSLLVCCIGSDLGGYIFGKIFKGPKLTKISPNKTISGSLGSLIFACVFFALMFFVFTFDFSYQILLIGIITSIACQLGDLLFSYLKRKAVLKDTGNFLPGHGGVLDRLDGVYLGVPIGFITILILN
tara:strand:+ start:2785 stop:3432 length:648 start_codon:yes stop_codon:yes gene_type:complete